MNKFISIFVLTVVLFACKKTEIIFNGVANEKLELPLLLDLNNKSCAFDAQNGILKYTIDKNSLNNFSPFVRFQNHSNIRFGNTELSNGAVNNLGDLELNKGYPISITTGGETNQFTIVFTNIPIVQIVAQSAITNGPKTLTRMIVNYPDEGRISDINWAGIEHRGKSSLAYDKKSYGIGIYSSESTNAPLSQSYFDMKLNHKWILDAMFVDLSKLRNKTSFELWNSMSNQVDHIGIKSQFVEVFINHEPQGVYSFTENYTKELLDLNTQSVLFQGTDNSLFTSFNALPEKGPNSAKWADWEQEYPNPSQTLNWDDFESLSKLIVNGTNSEFENNIGQLIDLENIIDYYLFINLCGGIDNIGKNWFFFKRDNSSKFNIVPWDMDGTWGRNPFAEMTGYTDIISSNLFYRLQETNPENYKQRLKERWAELRSSEFSEVELVDLFTSNFDELNSYKIIHSENVIWNTNLELEFEKNYIHSWIVNRLSFLDQHFEN